jgi:hypothetical protein
MRVFTVKPFGRFQRQERISDATLCQAVNDAERGQIDAELGNGLIKLRIARKGQGKRGGYRVLLAFRVEDRAVFLYGFAKNDRDNIDDDELVLFRKRAMELLGDIAHLEMMLADDRLREVPCDDEE